MAEKFITVAIPPDLTRKPGSLRFVEAEFPKRPHVPFAMIWYELGGERQEEALRLDLDKRIFLDHFSDARTNKLLAGAAPGLASFVARAKEEIV